MDTRHAHSKARGLNLSPPLYFEALPADVQSIAFQLVDRDANDFVHWAVIDLPPTPFRLPEGASGSEMPEPARELRNNHNTVGYYGPSPPPRSGAHRYEVVAYALDVDSLDVDEHADAAAFDAAARPHAVATATDYWMFEYR